MVRLENMMGHTTCLLLLVAPFVFVSSLFDFANLPQTIFIQSIAVLLLSTLCIKAVIEGRIKLSYNPMNLVVLAFLFWSFVSLFWARNRYEAFLPFIHLVACSLVFFVISNNLKKDKWIIGILAAVLSAGTGVALLGCAQYLFKIDWIPQAFPPAATFGNRNVASQFVSMVLPLLPVLFFYAQKRYLRFLTAFVTLTSLLYLFLAETRAGWVACIASVSFVVIAMVRDARARDSLVRISRKVVGATVILAIAFFVVSVILRPGLFRSFVDISKRAFRHEVIIGEAQKGGKVIYDDTREVRFTIWRNSLEMIKDRLVWGFGMGNFNVFYPIYHQRAIKDKIFGEELQLRSPHNDFIQTTVELGLVGLLLFLGLFVAAFVMAYRLTVHHQPPKIRLVVIGLTAGIIAFLVQAMFSFPMERAIPPLILFTYLGVLTVFYNRLVANDRTYTVKIAPGISIPVCATVLLASFVLIRFNVNNISGDRYYRATMEMEQIGAWPEVITAGLKSYKFNPHQMNALSSVGRAYIASDEVYKGIQTLQKVINAYPYNINAMVNLGVAYHKEGDEEKALETFKRVLEIKPDYPKVLANMGKIYMRHGDGENALRYFTKAAEYDNENILVHINLGFLKFKKGEYIEAAREYELVLKYDPEMVFAHKSLGMIYHKYLKQPDKAFYHMQKYIEMKPGDRASEQFKRILAARKLNRDRL